MRLAVELRRVGRQQALGAGRALLHLQLTLLELSDLVVLLLAAAVDDRPVQEGGHLVDLLAGPWRRQGHTVTGWDGRRPATVGQHPAAPGDDTSRSAEPLWAPASIGAGLINDQCWSGGGGGEGLRV